MNPITDTPNRYKRIPLVVLIQETPVHGSSRTRTHQWQSWPHSPWIWDVLGFSNWYVRVLLLFEQVKVSWLAICSDCKGKIELKFIRSCMQVNTSLDLGMHNSSIVTCCYSKLHDKFSFQNSIAYGNKATTSFVIYGFYGLLGLTLISITKSTVSRLQECSVYMQVTIHWRYQQVNKRQTWCSYVALPTYKFLLLKAVKQKDLPMTRLAIIHEKFDY